MRSLPRVNKHTMVEVKFQPLMYKYGEAESNSEEKLMSNNVCMCVEKGVGVIKYGVKKRRGGISGRKLK